MMFNYVGFDWRKRKLLYVPPLDQSLARRFGHDGQGERARERERERERERKQEREGGREGVVTGMMERPCEELIPRSAQAEYL